MITAGKSSYQPCVITDQSCSVQKSSRRLLRIVTLRLKQKQAQQQQNSSKNRATTTLSPITNIEGSHTPSAAAKQQNINIESKTKSIITYQQSQDFHCQCSTPTGPHSVCQRDRTLRGYVSQHQASSEPVQQDHQVFQQSKNEYNIPKRATQHQQSLQLSYLLSVYCYVHFRHCINITNGFAYYFLLRDLLSQAPGRVWQ